MKFARTPNNWLKRPASRSKFLRNAKAVPRKTECSRFSARAEPHLPRPCVSFASAQILRRAPERASVPCDARGRPIVVGAAGTCYLST
jgi:hypothetical protein